MKFKPRPQGKEGKIISKFVNIIYSHDEKNSTVEVRSYFSIAVAICKIGLCLYPSYEIQEENYNKYKIYNCLHIDMIALH